MRIAIPSTNSKGLDSKVSMHFGRAPYYTFVEIENGEIKDVKSIAVPFESHGPGDLPHFVKEHRGDIVIAYGIGARAIEFFQNLGIKIITGAYGRVGDVVQGFVKKSLETDKWWKENIEKDKRSGEHEHH